MAKFRLGNFAINEILYGVAQNFNDEILYTLDELSSASIEISSDPTEITDKNGNILRTIYKSKTGTFSATSALLSPNVLNAGSGSEIEVATSDAPIEMPKIVTVEAGKSIDVSDAVEGTIHVIGLFGTGANGAALTQSTSASLEDGTFGLADGVLTAPEAAEDAPVSYLVKYQRNVENGVKLSNMADKFPNTVRLTLFVSLTDPCSDEFKAAYIYIPSFQADPSMTISLDSETQEVDFSGNLQASACGTGTKDLYYIYIIDESSDVAGKVVSGTVEETP